MPYIRLACFKKDHIVINKRVPKKYRARLKRHMRVYRELRKNGYSRTVAIKRARRAEHRGMTKAEIFKYEGELGSIARRGK